MDSFAYQFPIPFYELAQAQQKTGPCGNSPFPVGLLSMPMQAAAHLFFRAETVQKTVEWTPLESGPGERIDYTGAAGWDGEKFVFTDTARAVIDPLGWYQQTAEYGLESDEAVRREIRNYDVLNASWNPPGGVKSAPGEWMLIHYYTNANPGEPVVGFGGLYSWVNESMRYDIAAGWEEAQTAFQQANQTALTDWKTRLDNWLAAEEAKPIPNENLIDDIQRQIQVQQALVTQVTTQQNLSITNIGLSRQDAIDQGIDADTADRWATNCLAAEQEAFGKWIAAEEILEAFAVTVFSLRKMRVDFRRWALHMLDGKWLGWIRTEAFPGMEFCGSRLSTTVLQGITTGSLSALKTGQIPALSSVDIGVILARPVAQLGIYPASTFVPALSSADLPAFQTAQDDVWKNSGALDYSTIFEIKTDPYVIATNLPTMQGDVLETKEVTSILYVGIGPVTFGFDAGSCSVPIAEFGNIPTYFPAVKIGGGLLSGESNSTITCPAKNQNCNPYILEFGELNDPITGAELVYDGSYVGEGDVNLEWAFQSPLATWTAPPTLPGEDPPALATSGPPAGTFNVEPLRALWAPAVSAIQEYKQPQNGVACGKFKIVNASNLTIFETDLFATANSVGALNIIWKVLTLRP